MLLLLIVETKNMFGLLPLTWRSYQLSWKSVTWFKNWKDWDTDRQIPQQWDLINLLPYIKEGMVTKNGMAAQWTQCSKECNLLLLNGMVRKALLNKYWINWNVQLTFWFDQNQYLLCLWRGKFTPFTHFFVSHVLVNSDMCAWVSREDEYLRNKFSHNKYQRWFIVLGYIYWEFQFYHSMCWGKHVHVNCSTCYLWIPCQLHITV